MDENRTRRVSEAVREELSELIEFEMDDPRLAGLSVTSVDVSPDMRHAHVKVAIGEGGGKERAVLAALEHAKSFLNRDLAARLNLRRVPELHFLIDAFPNVDERIDFLLKRAKKRQAKA